MIDANDFETRIEMAKTLYQGTHGLSITQLADITGMPSRQLSIYKRDQDWKKVLETKLGGQTEDAAEAQQFFAGAKVDTVKALAIAEASVADGTNLIAEEVPSEKDELIARHKKEWKVPRALSAQAMAMASTSPMQAMERAKLAKITSENLTLIQNGERRAFGIDKADGAHTIMLERS